LLETERLVLRRPSPDDADDLLELVGDEELMRWIGGEAGDRAVAVKSIERWIGRWEANGVGQFAVVLDGHVIGRVGLLVWDESIW
jgi:RimJ/RimL family protein N-acetyltransferase